MEVPAFDVHVRDTTGAGDAFHAGFAVGLLRGMPARACMRFACAVAALNCGGEGAQSALPTTAEVEALLRADETAR